VSNKLLLGNMKDLVNNTVSETSNKDIVIEATFDKTTNSLNMDLTGLPFWIWDQTKHQQAYMKNPGKCCFNHLVGLPVKEGMELPLFPYEKEVWDALFKPEYENPGNDFKRWKHIWIKKAAGMGITEFVMRLILYLPFVHPSNFKNSQIAIMTGIRMNTAKDIMDRMRSLLYQRLKIFIETSSTEMTINGCEIHSFPARTPQSLHGLSNPSFIFLDEFDFFPESLHEFVINAVERYFAKSNPYVILNSTAYKPDGLLEKIEKQTDEECKYKRLFLLWQKGYGYIYSKKDIELAQTSDSWAREYEGQYRGLKGNLFSQELLDYAAFLSDLLEIQDKSIGQVLRRIQRTTGELKLHEIISNYKYLGSGYPTSIGIDPAYNSSNFAFVVTKYDKDGGLIYVVKELELKAPTHEEAIETCKKLMYDDYPSYHPKLYIDASGVSFIRTLKKEIMDYGADNYHDMTQEQLTTSINSPNGMIACPIPFSKYGDRMNYHLKRLFELGLIRVSPDITPGVWTALQTASYNEDKQKFDKKNTAKNDCYDAFRLACINYKIGDISVLY
jgi:hypothetical protein